MSIHRCAVLLICAFVVHRHITSDLKWNSHIRNVCSKANRTVGFLRRNLFSCPQDVKEAAYKSMVRPILEYGSTVWDPHCNGLNDCVSKFTSLVRASD